MAGAGVLNIELKPHGARGRFRVSNHGVGTVSIGRIDKHGHTFGIRQQLP
jgi:hypothetical protein